MKKIFASLFVVSMLLAACGVVLPGEPPTAATATSAPAQPTVAPTATAQLTVAPTSAPTSAPSGLVSLKYDETNGSTLTAGQTQLIALYLRLTAPISQAALEGGVAQIQQEAAASNATTFEGQTLKLEQRQAWLVWCSDATQVDPPSDVSLIHEVTLLDPKTVGRVWIQVPFAQGVPLRSDDTWAGCPAKFWAVAVH